MKTLDRYIIRSFLHSYMLCFLVMMGLRIVSDLFLNMDEFAELEMTAVQRVAYVCTYYACNSLVYFKEMGGVILVAGAAFSLARMNHTNELTAVLASGMSLYRIILPVIMVAIVFALVGTANQEVFIPSIKEVLVRSHDNNESSSGMRVPLISDAERNVWHSALFQAADRTMLHPLVLCRDRRDKLIAKVSGRTAVYVTDGLWRMTDATVAVLNRKSRRSGGTSVFIWTPRSPEMLASSGSGQTDIVDGLRISFDRADPETGWLVRPRIEILAPTPGPAGKLRVFGTLVAPLAWYGPAGPKDRESGYHFVGDPALTDADVISRRDLCVRLAAMAGEPADQPGGQLWQRLALTTQTKLAGYAAAKGQQPGGELTEAVLAELNGVISGPAVVGVTDVAAMKLSIAPSDYAALAGEGQPTDAQAQRINRLVLDNLLAGATLPCQGRLRLQSSLTPDDIALRRTRKWLDFLSSREIGSVLRTGRVTDPDSARLIQHIRVAAPIIDVLMLMLALPFIVSRERHIKASALLCVIVVGGFHVFVFMSRYSGDEIFAFISAGLAEYGFAAASPIWGPIVAATLPILVFGPVAMVMLVSLESMERPGDNCTLGQVLTTLDGRVDRSTFWLRGLLPVLAVVAAALIVDALIIREPGLLTLAALVAAAWPIFALLVKRSHDRGRPGTFLLALLIPILGWLWVLFDLAALPGDDETNTYGTVPVHGVVGQN